MFRNHLLCFQIITFLLLFNGFSSLNILMFQVGFSPSHVRFSGSLSKILHDAGHNVDKIVQIYNPRIQIYELQSIRTLYRIEKNNSENSFLQMQHITDPFKIHDQSYTHTNNSFFTALGLFCEAIVADNKLIDRLRNERYDVMVTSAYTGCPYALAEILSIRGVVGFMPTAGAELIMELIGVPKPPSFVQSQFAPAKYALNFIERIKNIYHYIHIHNGDIFEYEQLAIDKYYPEIGRISSLIKKMTYVMVNTDEILEFVRPTSPKLKFVGGIASPSNVIPLNDDFENLLKIPSKGVVVMSFGSLVKTTQMPMEKKAEIVKAFAEFPDYTFIWKYDTIQEDKKIFSNATNIHLRSWLPQINLLIHPRIKVFISHMGQNSYLEVAAAGKPVIAIPVFNDQYYNADAAVHKGIAVKVDKTKINRKTMVEALKLVLENPRYARKAKEISRMLAAKPDKIGAKEFVKFVEYAATFPSLGTDVLQMASTELSLLQLYCVDVMLFLVLCAFISLATIIFVLKLIAKHIIHCDRPTQKKKEQ